MECCTKAVHIGRGSRLHFTVLLRSSVAWRAKSNGIPSLPWLEATGDAKVDQVDVVLSCEHDIGWFEVTKDYWRLACMQKIKHGTKLNSDVKDFIDGEASSFM